VVLPGSGSSGAFLSFRCRSAACRGEVQIEGWIKGKEGKERERKEERERAHGTVAETKDWDLDSAELSSAASRRWLYIRERVSTELLKDVSECRAMSIE
jgi:hypothetical protein